MENKIRLFNKSKVVGLVEYTDNLDHWDGRNMTCGSSGRHLGIGRLINGGFYLCHGTQWQGERDYAEVIDETKARDVILEHNPDLWPEFFDEPVPVLSEKVYPGATVFI